MDIMNAIATGETVISRPFKRSHSHYLRFALIIPLYREALLPNCNPTEEQHSSSNKTREQRISASAGWAFPFLNSKKQEKFEAVASASKQKILRLLKTDTLECSSISTPWWSMYLGNWMEIGQSRWLYMMLPTLLSSCCYTVPMIMRVKIHMCTRASSNSVIHSGNMRSHAGKSNRIAWFGKIQLFNIPTKFSG